MSDKAYEKALNLALYYLSLKARTERELRTKLQDKEVAPDTAKAVMAFLKDKQWVDDAAYAMRYIESTQSRYGKYKLQMKLRQKGIDDAVIEAAIADLTEEEELVDERDRAGQLLNKKISTLSVDWALIESDYAYKNKLYGKLCRFLFSRGFSSDIVKQVVGERLAQEFFDEF